MPVKAVNRNSPFVFPLESQQSHPSRLIGYMDIDYEEGTQTQNTNAGKKRIIAPVDDAHPFDLDGYIANYTGTFLDLKTRHN